MIRKFALILLPLALLATACSSDAKDNDDASNDGPSSTATAEPTTSARDDTTDGGGSSALFGAFNPLDLLNNAGQPSFGEVDPSLKAALLSEDDLPDGYLSMGDFTFTAPSELGDLEIAASMFSTMDAASEEFGPMVWSAAVAIPPEALDEIGDPGDLADSAQAEFDELERSLRETGLGLSDLRLLDASGLGDGGVGIHLVLDLGALLGAFGAPEDAFLDGGIAMDMYMFIRGDHMLMTMVMWPGATSSGVDGHELAEVMDARAASAF